MLSAVIALPKGATRNLLLKELRLLKVRIIEAQDSDSAPTALSRKAIDLFVIGSEPPRSPALRQLLESKGSRRPQVIIVETSRRQLGSPGPKEKAWCLHRPVRPCVIRGYVRSLMERKRLEDQLRRLQPSRENPEEHSVDTLWFSIFERLQSKSNG
jgi:hypothetical protein